MQNNFVFFLDVDNTLLDNDRILFPTTEQVMKHLAHLGRVIIFSEGDSVYQREKIEKSGLGDLADEVLLYEHKLDHTEELEERYGDATLVFVEDKPQILDAILKRLPEAFTVLVCQGHYAGEDHGEHGEPDMTLKSISDLLSLSLQDFKRPPTQSIYYGTAVRGR